MKILVKTTGPHFYVCPSTMQTVEHNRPSVVTSTQFFQTLVFKGALEVHPTPLQETATDAEFLKFLVASENNLGLATESFMSKYAVGATAEDDTEAQAEAARVAAEAEAEAARVVAEVEAQNQAEAARIAAEAEAEATRVAAAEAEAAAKAAAEADAATKKTTTATKK